MTRLVSRRWADELTLELRARDVPGKEIGDALAHVESFCADSGQSAEEAFGAPREYASGLWPERPADAPTGWRPGVGQVTVLVLQVASFGLLTQGVPALVRGEEVAVTADAFVIALVAVALLTLLLHRLDDVLRWVMRAGILRVTGAAMVPTVLMAGAGLGVRWLAPDTLWLVPAGPAVAVPVVLLLAPAVHATVRPTADGVDPLVGPFDDEERVERSATRLDRLVAWVVPAFAVVVVGMSLAVDALTPR